MRQEFTARRGKVLHQGGLGFRHTSRARLVQGDPKFTDASLSPIERTTSRPLPPMEKKAVSAMSVIEG